MEVPRRFAGEVENDAAESLAGDFAVSFRHRRRYFVSDCTFCGMVLGAGLEPACLAAYAPQTYVSAISPPEPLKAKPSASH